MNWFAKKISYLSLTVIKVKTSTLGKYTTFRQSDLQILIFHGNKFVSFVTMDYNKFFTKASMR